MVGSIGFYSFVHFYFFTSKIPFIFFIIYLASGSTMVESIDPPGGWRSHRFDSGPDFKTLVHDDHF